MTRVDPETDNSAVENHKVLWLVKNKFTKEGMDQFLRDPVNCFLFEHFARGQEGQRFLSEKCDFVRSHIQEKMTEQEKREYIAIRKMKIMNQLRRISIESKRNSDWQAFLNEKQLVNNA